MNYPEGVTPRGFKSFQNTHLTYDVRIKNLFSVWNPLRQYDIDRYRAASLSLLQMIDLALEEELRLRAYGGNWSWTLIAPAQRGWMLDTRPLRLLFDLAPEDIAADYAGDRAGLRFAQCGISIKDLDDRLKRSGRALRTHGASNGQTLAGAVATGTHGSAFDVGNLSDSVVGLHVLLENGRSVWIERASYPAASDDFLELIGVTEIMRDDPMFDAAVISIGSFGIIHGLLIETVPLYVLRFAREKVPFDDQLKLLIESQDFALPRPYHFEVVVNPYDQQNVYRSTAYVLDPPPDHYDPPPYNPDGDGFSSDMPGVVGTITDKVPGAIPAIMRKLFDSAYGPREGVGTIGEIWSNTTTRGRTASTAIGIPLEFAMDAMETMLDLYRTDGPFAAAPAMRFIKGGRHTLRWARFPRTCVIEADGPYSERTLHLYELFWQRLTDAAIPHAFHWGKFFPADANVIAQCYGADRAQWIAQRERLMPNPAVRDCFANDLLDRIGLSS